MTERLVYLHGFASGPASRKATFFRDRLASEGKTLEVPDLSAGDFEHLTIGGQLRILEDLLEGEKAILIGSSMGGYLAALYAARHLEITSLLLLAPAFRLARHWREVVGAEALEKWKRSGVMPVYHYGEARMRNLSYGFVEESEGWEPEPVFGQPAQIFHGTRDTVVPPRFSAEYAERHSHIHLTLLDSDHELTGVLDTIWESWRGGYGRSRAIIPAPKCS